MKAWCRCRKIVSSGRKYANRQVRNGIVEPELFIIFCFHVVSSW